MSSLPPEGCEVPEGSVPRCRAPLRPPHAFGAGPLLSYAEAGYTLRAPIGLFQAALMELCVNLQNNCSFRNVADRFFTFFSIFVQNMIVKARYTLIGIAMALLNSILVKSS